MRPAGGVALLLLALWGGAVAAAPCRLALLLAVDVSASVDAGEYVLQRDGLAAALDAPEVREAILQGRGPVALAAYEWSGRYQQATILPWVLLDSAGAIDAAVARIGAMHRVHEGFPTAAGYALGHGAGMLLQAPACDRQVIDVSGDGVNNEGFGPALAYANFPFDGVVVNGLAIAGSDGDVVRFYRDELRHGPGAFVEIARGFADFRRAMTRKLYRETQEMVLGRAGDAAGDGPPRANF